MIFFLKKKIFFDAIFFFKENYHPVLSENVPKIQSDESARSATSIISPIY